MSPKHKQFCDIPLDKCHGKPTATMHMHFEIVGVIPLFVEVEEPKAVKLVRRNKVLQTTCSSDTVTVLRHPSKHQDH